MEMILIMWRVLHHLILPSDGIDYPGDVGIQGKQVSPKEDKMILKAISICINEHGLGDEGKDIILHCKKHPEVKGCWEEKNGSALSWRSFKSVIFRALSLLEKRRRL